MNKEYLYHGSPVKVDILKPNQAVDAGFKEGCQLAVYATSDINMAKCFALGCIPDAEDYERTMMPEYGGKMIFKNCHPNYGGKGYVYCLDKTKFVHAMGSQYVCYEEISPEEVIEIEVDDCLNLIQLEGANGDSPTLQLEGAERDCPHLHLKNDKKSDELFF